MSEWHGCVSHPSDSLLSLLLSLLSLTTLTVKVLHGDTMTEEVAETEEAKGRCGPVPD